MPPEHGQFAADQVVIAGPQMPGQHQHHDAGHLRPGYDYLVRRKLPSFWRDLPHGPMAADMAGFLGAAAELGFTERTRGAVASQVVGRLLIQTGRGLGQLTDTDLDELLGACRNAKTPTAPSCATTSGRCTPPARCCSTSACSTPHR